MLSRPRHPPLLSVSQLTKTRVVLVLMMKYYLWQVATPVASALADRAASRKHVMAPGMIVAALAAGYRPRFLGLFWPLRPHPSDSAGIPLASQTGCDVPRCDDAGHGLVQVPAVLHVHGHLLWRGAGGGRGQLLRDAEHGRRRDGFLAARAQGTGSGARSLLVPPHPPSASPFVSLLCAAQLSVRVRGDNGINHDKN